MLNITYINFIKYFFVLNNVINQFAYQEDHIKTLNQKIKEKTSTNYPKKYLLQHSAAKKKIEKNRGCYKRIQIYFLKKALQYESSQNKQNISAIYRTTKFARKITNYFPTIYFFNDSKKTVENSIRINSAFTISKVREKIFKAKKNNQRKNKKYRTTFQ
eukprot:TRINITY_DN7600_c0_g4_i1.p3 TRINITY_DN7600_c0_g4~~TRINITY_DN7600_c0_g4_i1.p3  ORF type:complete len:159 (+),score=6.87 TRINITY_DN7600_c0_g4_i1:1113-1589(+)